MFITIICGLFSCNGRKQSYIKAAGLGLLSVNTQFPILLYKNQNDQIPFDTLKFVTTKSGCLSFVSNIQLKPYQMSEGDSDKEGEQNVSRGLVRFPPDLKFCVIEAGRSYFRVITNENTMETFVIKKNVASMYYTDVKMLDEHFSGATQNSSWYVYETWERYLKRAEYITKKNVIIYNTPKGKAIFENKSGAFQAFVVTEVKGDWVRLSERDGRSEESASSQKLEGWTQWREGGKMLIDIVEKTYD